MKIGIILGFCLMCIVSFAFAQGSMYEEPGNDLTSGQVTVATANTAVPLSSVEKRILEVTLFCLTNNSPQGITYVGDSTVTTSTGFVVPRAASDSVITLKINDLNKVYINSAVAGDGVYYIAIER